MLQGCVWNWLCYPEPATSGDTDVVFEMKNERTVSLIRKFVLTRTAAYVCGVRKTSFMGCKRVNCSTRARHQRPRAHDASNLLKTFGELDRNNMAQTSYIHISEICY